MSNELLPSPDIFAAPVSDVEHADNKTAAAGDGPAVAADDASRRPDSQIFADTFARLEAAVQGSLGASADISSKLPGLLATIEQIEAALRQADTSAPDVHFAIEHIQDIAMALRQREVEPALCDTLETAIREVGDAIVRSDAAIARTQGATALLGDLARRVTDLVALATTVEESAPEPGRAVVEPEAPNGKADWFDDAFDRSTADTAVEARVVDALMSEDDVAALLLGSVSARSQLPDKEADAAPDEVPSDSFEAASHKMEAVTEYLSLDLIAPGFAASHEVEPGLESDVAANAVMALPPPSVDERPPPQLDSRAALNDPLMALHALSEEEVIALFT
jgi:hypothetical protein